MFTAAVRTLRYHWVMALLVISGVVLRVLTVLAYKPALMFFGDSYAYVVAAQRFQPPNDRPFGYAFVLRLISYVGNLGTVTILQHILGLALAIILYIVILRRGAPRWLAALAATPLILDAYIIQIEHNILSETMFASLLLGAVLIATREELTPRWAVAAGLFLAAAALTRTVAIPIAVIFIAYLLVRKLGRQVVLGFVLAMAIPIIWYMSWFASYYNTFATTDSGGRFLYGRVAVFADCSKTQLNDAEATLCDNAAPQLRPNANFYVWASDSPLQAVNVYDGNTDKVASSFSKKIILAQPVTYLSYVTTDFFHYFALGKYTTRVDSPLGAWQFPVTYSDPVASSAIAQNDLQGNPIQPLMRLGLAQFLKAYQSIVYTQGPLLLAGAILGLLASFLSRGRRRWDGAFVSLVGISVLAIPCFTVMFDYRYGLPVIPLFMLSGAIGIQAILERRAAKVSAELPLQAEADLPQGEVADTNATPPSRHKPASRPQRPGWVVAFWAGGIAAIVTTVAWSAPLVRNPAFEAYISYRASMGPLGPALSNRVPVDGVNDVTDQKFVSGDIVATSTGAVVIPQRFMDGVEKAGGLEVLGAARGRETQTSYNPGLRYVTFDNGAVFWSRLGGAHAVYGDVYDAWVGSKIRGRLREPIADAQTTPEGGAFQKFAGGSITEFADGSVKIAVNPVRPSGEPSTATTVDPNRPASATKP